MAPKHVAAAFRGILVTLPKSEVGKPVVLSEFRDGRITDTWQTYAGVLNFGKGQRLVFAGTALELRR